jgi:hypothetical protein
MMQGVEHDEAISIYVLQMQARRLLRRHCPSPLSPALTPRNDNSEAFQQSPGWGRASRLICERSEKHRDRVFVMI